MEQKSKLLNALLNLLKDITHGRAQDQKTDSEQTRTNKANNQHWDKQRANGFAPAKLVDAFHRFID